VKSEKFAAAWKNSQFSILNSHFFIYLSPRVKVSFTSEKSKYIWFFIWFALPLQSQ